LCIHQKIGEYMDENQTAPSPAPQETASNQASVPPADLIDIEYLSKLQLRIAKIEAAEAVPKSKKLVKLQIDVGPKLGKRQILAGIAQYHSPESLIGKKIVIVANLKPATLMGHQSQGMLLAALSEDNTTLAILQPGVDIPEGSEVR
jgi:methionyl-tRNA synthetase